MSDALELSVVIPMFNEADNVQLLWEELDAVLAKLGLRAEILFVDDGSTDRTVDAVRAVMKDDPRVRLLRFESNAGLTAAFHAGYAAARAPLVATIDADLQNDPRDLEPLLKALENADAAVGYRMQRHDRWRKRIASRIANFIRNRLTGEDIRDSACSLRVMRRECLAALPPYSGMHRFVPTLLRIAGFRVREVPVHHRARHLGQSKFGIWDRALPAFVDLLVVRWMMRRTFRAQARDVTHAEDEIG